MWRTVIINNAEKVNLKDGWLIVQTDKEVRVPVNELYSVVIDNPNTMLSVSAVNALTQAGVHILYCGEKHLPVSVVLPYNTHYRPLNVIRKQLAWNNEFCENIWKNIIIAKIRNQAQVLKMSGCRVKAYDHLIKFSEDVLPGDITNREGLSAKMFFRELYGSAFIRMGDDAINHALNYGYAIIRSAVAKTLCAYGYNPVIGLHHINETNPFNLADGLMEPLRPIVDLWVDQNHEDLFDELTPDNKRKLVNLINEIVLLGGKKMKVRNAIDKYVSSLTTAVNKNNYKELKIPEIINATLEEMMRGCEGD